MARIRPLLAGLLLLLPGCNSEQANPFENAPPIVALKPTNAIVLTSGLWAGRARAPREIYGVDADGSNLTRVTFCNSSSAACDNLEAVPSPDGLRLAARRIAKDANGDGRLTDEDGVALFILDPARGIEAPLTLRVPSGTSAPPTVTKRVSGVDWTPAGDVLAYSAEGAGDLDDIYRTVPRIDVDMSQTGALSSTSDTSERRPRVSPAAIYVAYERGVASRPTEVWLFQSQVQQAQVTSGGPGSGSLPDGSYTLGSDADPDFSPDGGSLVFRRLVAIGADGAGAWDIYTVRADGSGLARIAEGPLYRGAPDWGPSGITFVETDASGSRLVTMRVDGSDRRVILSAAAGVAISAPRWRR
jgi:Tol biopolymer transport system component